MHWSCFTIFIIVIQVTSINGYVSSCVKSGVKCSDCEHLIHCVKTPRGMTKYQLNFCNNTENQYCSVEEGGCSSDPTSCKIFGLQEFPCQNSSTFPDPYDCNSYHQCIQQVDGSLTPIRYNCAEERAYDPLTGTCRFRQTHRVCRESPVPKCLVPLQTGPLNGNPAIFYVCKKDNISGLIDYTPLLYRCRTGEQYKATAHACVEMEESQIFSCIAEGTFPDLNDNSKYYRCNKDKTYFHASCEKGHYFNSEKASCQKISEL